jgi:ribosomal protein S18 acetylase RimI-like enzyme
MVPVDPDPVQVRFLKRQDIPSLLELWRAANLTIRPAGREHPDRLASELAEYPRNFMGAFDGDRLVGALIATWDGRRGWINRLAVHPQARRRGLATRLIAAAEAELKSRGALVIAALVEPSNVPSLSLFSASGYRDVPRAVFLSKREGPDV